MRVDLNEPRWLRIDDLRRTIDELRAALPVDAPIVPLPSIRSRDRGEVLHGMPIPFGLASFSFFDRQYGDYAVLDRAHIYVTAGVLRGPHLQALLPPMERALRAQAPVLLVADEVDESTLALLAVNRQKGTLTAAALLPDRLAGDNALAAFAALTQCGVGQITDEGVTFAEPGTAPRLIASLRETVVVGPVPMMLASARVGLLHVGGEDPQVVRARTQAAQHLLSSAMN